MKQAGIVLNQINFFEYHDIFNIYGRLQLEAIGFALKGKGWKLAEDGEIGLKGKIPCATMGGMKARGFAGGASGVYQASKQWHSFGSGRSETRSRMPSTGSSGTWRTSIHSNQSYFAKIGLEIS